MEVIWLFHSLNLSNSIGQPSNVYLLVLLFCFWALLNINSSLIFSLFQHSKVGFVSGCCIELYYSDTGFTCRKNYSAREVKNFWLWRYGFDVFSYSTLQRLHHDGKECYKLISILTFHYIWSISKKQQMRLIWKWNPILVLSPYISMIILKFISLLIFLLDSVSRWVTNLQYDVQVLLHLRRFIINIRHDSQGMPWWKSRRMFEIPPQVVGLILQTKTL